MPDTREALRSKLREAEQLSARIRTQPQSEDIQRWAVVGDEVQRLMILAEEQLPPGQLARLKAEINGTEPGSLDLWAKYRDSEWRLPKLGGPGPGDPPPSTIPLRDFLI